MTAPNRGSAKRAASRAATLVTLTVLVAVIAAVALGAFAVFGKGGSSNPEVTTADIVTAQRMDFSITTTATGDLAARSQVEVRSQLDDETTILEVIDEGVTVRKGDLLVRLNSERIQTEMDEEELRVESAKADVVAADNAYLIQESRNTSAVRDATLDVELKKLALKQWLEGDDKKELQKIRLRIERADRELDRLKRELAKDEQLHERDFLSDNELDISRLRVLEAEAESETASLEEEIYKSYIRPREQKTRESDVVQAEAKLIEVAAQNEIELVSKDAKRSYERSQLSRRESRMERYKADIEASEIRAPTDGLVVYGTSVQRDRMYGNSSEGPLQIGRRVHPNMLLVILPDTSEMMAQVRVHESLVGQIHAGQEVEIKIDAADGQIYKGTVTDIGVLAEGGGWRDPNRREYTVKIALDVDGEEAKLKPSMRCEATIIMDHVVDGLAIPLPALFSESGVKYVYLREGGRFVKRPIKIGRRSDAYVEVLSGLQEGDRVLAREPSSIEVVQRDWDVDELKIAGYQIDANGEVVSTARAAGGMPGRPDPRRMGNPMGRTGRPTGMNAGGRHGGRPASTDETESADTESDEPQ
jgi:HlyD family secretion protein